MMAKVAAKSGSLRVVMTGGGSGGHITPALAVAAQLKALQPDCVIYYVSQTDDPMIDIPAADPNIDHVYQVRAGKLRRYHGEGLRQLFDLPTTALNVRDAGFVVAGLAQSYRLLRRLRPDVIFTRGSFVSVPVCLAASWLGIPYITHDSDAIPSLANRLIAKRASRNAVALPPEVYPYPPAKTVMTGIPISDKFKMADEPERAAIRRRLGLDPRQRVVLVTGGGLGAMRLNHAVQTIVPELLETNSDLVLVHMAGRNHEKAVSQAYDSQLSDTARPRVLALGFASNLFEYSAIADVVITRAGGTAMAEFAAQAKACIVVPNPQLTGGHQSKNAQALADHQAIRVVSEAELQRDPKALLAPLQALLDDTVARESLGKHLYQLAARPDAARQLAMLLLDVASKQTINSTDKWHETVQKP